jgi:NAD(P)-binding Rossmann-like domain
MRGAQPTQWHKPTTEMSVTKDATTDAVESLLEPNNVQFAGRLHAKKILERFHRRYEQQLCTQLANLRIGGPLGLLSVPVLEATEFADIDIPASISAWLGNSNKLHSGIPPGLMSHCAEACKRREWRRPLSIGILGAGVAGLYTALMIDSLGPDSGVTYEILEADERVGGHLYTYRFEGHDPNDYYVRTLLTSASSPNP